MQSLTVSSSLCLRVSVIFVRPTVCPESILLLFAYESLSDELLDRNRGVVESRGVEKTSERSEDNDDGKDPEEKPVDHDSDVAPIVLLTLDEVLLNVKEGFI